MGNNFLYIIMSEFEVWRNKQKLLDHLFWEILEKKEKEQGWRNKELSWNERYKLWVKGYAAFYKNRLEFHRKLREEIFVKNNLELTQEVAEKMF